jgi:hypothetical protein
MQTQKTFGWIRAAVLLTWLTSLWLLVPLPWDFAAEAERSLEQAHNFAVERAAKTGEQAPPGLSPEDRALARRGAWLEWLWLFVAVTGGIAVAVWPRLALKPWAVGTLAFALVYVLCRYYFEGASFAETTRALFDEEARESRKFLLDVAPASFGRMMFFNFLVPAVLILAPVLRLLTQRRGPPSQSP